jgi:hypothetical protein
MRPLTPGTYRTDPGEYYGTPKEIWGFRAPGGTGSPRAIARRFLAANAEMLGLTGILSQLGTRVRTLSSLGATHVIHQQRHGGKRVHRAYVTVHIGAWREVYLVKNRAMPGKMLPPGGERSPYRVQEAKELVLGWLGVKREHVVPPIGHELLWYPWKDRLVLAHKVRVHVGRRRRRPAQEWIVYLEAATAEILDAIDNLAEASGRGLVFVPNPVIALGGSAAVLTGKGRPLRRIPRAAYETVRLEGLFRGKLLDGKRVTTGPTRRAVTGKRRIARADRDYRVLAHENGFEEVMAYYHIDAAIRRLESMGYRGRRAIFREPLPVNVSATLDDQSWYSPGWRQISFGRGGGVNDAEDAETILHEFGHALQDFICPDFGQSDEAGAMGEGFGDYLALSSFAERKAHMPAYKTAVMSWDAIGWRKREPRCLRNIATRKTYASFAPGRGVHENGRIWAATLWDVREALGREVADRLVVESHFQLDGFTTFARGARAILDADDNLHGGEHHNRLRGIFRRRRIGPIHGAG